MKTIKYFATLLMATLLGFSCGELEKVEASAPSDVAPPAFSAIESVVVTEQNLSDPLTFEWSAVDYGYSAEVTYTVYIETPEGEAYQIGQSFAPSYETTNELFNNLLVGNKGLALPVGETLLSVYVTSSISASNEEYTFKSAPVEMNITTIASTEAAWIRRKIYVPGAHQNWNPASAPILWETAEFSNIYEGMVYLAIPDGGDVYFKFCATPDWNANFGAAAGDPVLVANGDNIVASSGTYWVSVELADDLSTGEYKLTPVSTIGVIGTAIGGWDPSNDLVLSPKGLPSAAGDAWYAAVNSQVWSAVKSGAVTGDYKFRLNRDWAVNWGGDLNALTLGGDNLMSSYEGSVEFSIDFRGDEDALATDYNNPSPIRGAITQQ